MLKSWSGSSSRTNCNAHKSEMNILNSTTSCSNWNETNLYIEFDKWETTTHYNIDETLWEHEKEKEMNRNRQHSHRHNGKSESKHALKWKWFVIKRDNQIVYPENCLLKPHSQNLCCLISAIFFFSVQIHLCVFSFDDGWPTSTWYEKLDVFVSCMLVCVYSVYLSGECKLCAQKL